MEGGIFNHCFKQKSFHRPWKEKAGCYRPWEERVGCFDSLEWNELQSGWAFGFLAILPFGSSIAIEFCLRNP